MLCVRNAIVCMLLCAYLFSHPMTQVLGAHISRANRRKVHSAPRLVGIHGDSFVAVHTEAANSRPGSRIEDEPDRLRSHSTCLLVYV